MRQRPRNGDDASLRREKAIYVLMVTVWANSRGSRTLGGTGFQAGQIIRFLVAITTTCSDFKHFITCNSCPAQYHAKAYHTPFDPLGDTMLVPHPGVKSRPERRRSTSRGTKLSIKAVIGRWIRDRWMTQTQSFHRRFTSHTSPTISVGCFKSVLILTQTKILVVSVPTPNKAVTITWNVFSASFIF